MTEQANNEAAVLIHVPKDLLEWLGRDAAKLEHARPRKSHIVWILSQYREQEAKTKQPKTKRERIAA